MKRHLVFILLFLFAFTPTSPPFLNAGTEKTDRKQALDSLGWEIFSKNLLSALGSENEGLRLSAMKTVIKYKEKVNIDKSIVELVRLYRNSPDERIRRFALVTIYQLKNDWALGIIQRDLPYETSLQIKNLMLVILNDDFKKLLEDEEIVAFLRN